MPSVNIDQTASLDERYLEFAARTASVFQRYPQIEPLRHFIFKELLVKRTAAGRADLIKQRLRPFARTGRSVLPPDRADVVIVVESRREVIVDALLPVHRELTSLGVKVKLISIRGPEDLGSPAVDFRWRTPTRVPAWAKVAWPELYAAEPSLEDNWLGRSFYISCTSIQGMVDECDRVLAALKPKLVVIASTQLPGGASMIFAARQRGVSSVLLQHGILQPFYTPLTADYMLTWGESSSETLERLNVPSDRLSALGSPRHDAMAPTNNDDARRALIQGLGLRDRPTFVFFSNGNDLVRNGRAPLECAQWLESTAAEYSSEVNVVVRLHPNEDGSLYRDCPNLRLTKDALELTTVLEGCDSVGSLCSTVLYDALLYRKPVLQFYADGWPELADNWKYGLAQRISSQTELKGKIRQLLDPASEFSFDEGISDRVFAHHGFAASSVAGFIEHHLISEVGQNGGAAYPGVERAGITVRPVATG